jgi:hypothetical protein
MAPCVVLKFTVVVKFFRDSGLNRFLWVLLAENGMQWFVQLGIREKLEHPCHMMQTLDARKRSAHSIQKGCPHSFLLPHFLALAFCARCLRLMGTILGLSGAFFVAKCPNLAFPRAMHAFAHVFYACCVACLAFLDEFYAW